MIKSCYKTKKDVLEWCYSKKNFSHEQWKKNAEKNLLNPDKKFRVVFAGLIYRFFVCQINTLIYM